MYGEMKDKFSLDVDVAGYIVNETRELSLEDLMDRTSHSGRSRFAFSHRTTIKNCIV